MNGNAVRLTTGEMLEALLPDIQQRQDRSDFDKSFLWLSTRFWVQHEFIKMSRRGVKELSQLATKAERSRMTDKPEEQSIE